MPYYAAGQKLRAYDLNAAPVEWPLGGQWRTTTSAGVTTTETVILTSPTVTIPANTTVAIELDMLWTSSVTADQANFRIRQTNLTGTLVASAVTYAATNGNGGPYPYNMHGFYQTGGSPATLPFVATVVRAAGTGSITTYAQSSLIVKQLGANGTFTQV